MLVTRRISNRQVQGWLPLAAMRSPEVLPSGRGPGTIIVELPDVCDAVCQRAGTIEA